MQTTVDIPAPSHDTAQHRFFDLVVILKGLNGLLELAIGAALVLLPAGALVVFAAYVTQSDPAVEPANFVARSIMRWAQHFAHDTQILAAIYLLFHGIAKITLATLLLMGKRIAYPIAIAFFTVFVCYLSFRLAFHHWSWVIASFVGFDVLTIAVIAREWAVETGGRFDLALRGG